jgi:hypothetical protein
MVTITNHLHAEYLSCSLFRNTLIYPRFRVFQSIERYCTVVLQKSASLVLRPFLTAPDKSDRLNLYVYVDNGVFRAA